MVTFFFSMMIIHYIYVYITHTHTHSLLLIFFSFNTIDIHAVFYHIFTHTHTHLLFFVCTEFRISWQRINCHSFIHWMSRFFFCFFSPLLYHDNFGQFIIIAHCIKCRELWIVYAHTYIRPKLEKKWKKNYLKIHNFKLWINWWRNDRSINGSMNEMPSG